MDHGLIIHQRKFLIFYHLFYAQLANGFQCICCHQLLKPIIRSGSKPNTFLLDDYDLLANNYLSKHNKCNHLLKECCWQCKHLVWVQNCLFYYILSTCQEVPTPGSTLLACNFNYWNYYWDCWILGWRGSNLHQIILVLQYFEAFLLSSCAHVFFYKTDIIGIFCTEDALNFWLLKKVLKWSDW